MAGARIDVYDADAMASGRQGIECFEVAILNKHRDERPAVLYFGNDWFAENRTSSHHVARQLARHYRVYYLECPGLRAPTSSGRDLRKIWHKFKSFSRGLRPGVDGLKVRTLLQIPLHRIRLVRWANQLLTLATVRLLMWRENVHDPISWFVVPHMAGLVGKLRERVAVYYCIDDYSHLPGVNSAAVQNMDDVLTRGADVVFVASETLLQQKQALNPNTHVSPHGVDIEHFAKAQDTCLSTPAELQLLPRPIVGFFGLIERWIDLDLVDFLAEQRPELTFVMIGRIAVADERLPRRPNIHFIGNKPYEDLPAYGRHFDATIIPYRLEGQVPHANPLKLREYLAMGKPIVSVSIPEIDKFADVVAIARTPNEFLARLDDVIQSPSSQADTRQRMQRVAGMSWRSRVEQVLRIVESGTKTDKAAANGLSLPSLKISGGASI
jgi:glycosyltransferase involved in cell wall biosynthesis